MKLYKKMYKGSRQMGKYTIIGMGWIYHKRQRDFWYIASATAAFRINLVLTFFWWVPNSSSGFCSQPLVPFVHCCCLLPWVLWVRSVSVKGMNYSLPSPSEMYLQIFVDLRDCAPVYMARIRVVMRCREDGDQFSIGIFAVAVCCHLKI